MKRFSIVFAAACLHMACGGVEPLSADAVADCQAKALAAVREAARSALRDVGELKASKAYSMVSREERNALDAAADLCRLALRGDAAGFPRTTAENHEVFSQGSLPQEAAIAVLSDGCRVWAPDGIRSGDLVFSRENGMLARTFWDASTREKRFTHVGIVVKGGKDPLIMTADGKPEGAACVAWRDFFADALDGAVYRHVSSGAAIARAAQGMEGKPFDSAFDLKTKDRLYCTEMVRDCVNEAVGREVIGTSKRGDFEYVAVDDCYRNEMTKVWDCRDEKPDAGFPAQKPESLPAMHGAAGRNSATNAPVRRTIRFVPKNENRR